MLVGRVDDLGPAVAGERQLHQALDAVRLERRLDPRRRCDPERGPCCPASSRMGISAVLGEDARLPARQWKSPLVGRDLERRRLLVVERTQPFEAAAARALELQVLADDLVDLRRARGPARCPRPGCVPGRPSAAAGDHGGGRRRRCGGRVPAADDELQPEQEDLVVRAGARVRRSASGAVTSLRSSPLSATAVPSIRYSMGPPPARRPPHLDRVPSRSSAQVFVQKDVCRARSRAAPSGSTAQPADERRPGAW